MRFLLLTQYFPPEVGASQVRLGAVARALKQYGHDVEIVTALPNYPTGRILPGYRGHFYVLDNFHGIPVHRVWIYPAVGAGLRRLINYGSFVATSLVGLFRSQRPEYVFVESPPLFLALPGAFAAAQWKAGMILNVADLWPDSVEQLRVLQGGVLLDLARRLEKWAYHRATFVNAVTESIRRTLTERKGVPPEKVLFLPNGVDPEEFKPMAPDAQLMRELGIGNKKIILYAGTLGFAHGLDVILRAFVYWKEGVRQVEVLFVGDGPDRKRLQTLSMELGLDNVRFVPPQSHEVIAKLYGISYAGITTQKNLPLLEGNRPAKIPVIMACGKPVIFSGSGEAARLIESAQSGIVVPPEDPEALATAMRELVDNPAWAEKLGQNGRRYVEEKLSWSVLIKDWLRQLHERSGCI